MTKRQSSKATLRTRQAIQHLLKREGTLTAQAIADMLGVTAMAARQHLYELQRSGAVTYDERREEGRGRPSKRWALTDAANSFFPDGHGDLVVDIIGAMKTAFGEPGLERMLAVRTAQQIEAYEIEIDRTAPLAERLRSLTEIRNREGYMAVLQPEENDGFLFIENHCPICAAARSCTGLCRSELEVFRAALGADVEIERVEHLLAGARRCAYRVRSRSD